MKNPDEMYWFYSSVLGIDVERNLTPGTLTLKLASDVKVFVYSKVDHVPAAHTVIHFQVDDIEKAVDELTRKGVRFEHYNRSDKKGIVREFDKTGPDIAWFKDPSGNILGLIQYH